MRANATSHYHLLFLLALLAACGAKPSLEVSETPPWKPDEATVAPDKLLRGCDEDRFHIDVARMVDVALQSQSDERAEQWRDLVFPILLARIETRDGLDGLLVENAGQPLMRDDALAHVFEQPVGSTRTAVARDGTVVVMVEDGPEEDLQHTQLEAIDQRALEAMGTPKRALVYRYALDQASGYAEMCLAARLDRDALESEETGFRRATLSTARDLDGFLADGVDLMSAQCTEKGLEVTGRSRPRTSLTPLTSEHVAALYSPKQWDYVPIDELRDYLPPKNSDELAEWLGLMSHLIERPKLLKLPDVKKKLDEQTMTMLQTAIRWKRKHRKVPTHHLVLSWMGQNLDPRRLGFSLDPKMRAKDAARSMGALHAASDDPRELAALLYSWQVSPNEATTLVRALDEIGGTAEFFDKHFSHMHKLLKGKRVDALRTLRSWMESNGELGSSLLANAVRLLAEHEGYQCARYDGPLQGTEVGMTMFYTDLVMKLWAGDRFESSPEGFLPGFESVVSHDLSEAHCTEEEDKYPNTRAWLGLREQQYTREDADRVRFAPIAVRVFARSSRYGAEYSEETEATAGMRRFYRWWNAHYADVAAWEPQYELLNQITKWSIVVHQADLSEHSDCLGFLEDVPVRRNHRFDRWVANNESLRWRGPVELVHQRHEKTECIPLLRSRAYENCGVARNLVGGVAVASKLGVGRKVVRKVATRRPVGQLDLSARKPSRVAKDGSVNYETLERPNGILRNVRVDMGKRSVSAEIDLSQTQRGVRHSYRVGGDKARPVTRVDQTRHLDNDRLIAHGKVNNKLGTAQLETGDLTQVQIQARATQLEVARARDLGERATRRMARAKKLSGKKKSLSQVVGDMPQVQKAWKLDDNTVLVRVGGAKSARYAVMSSGGGNRGPPGILRTRVGRPDGAVEVAIVERKVAQNLAKKATEVSKSEDASTLVQLDETLRTGRVGDARKSIDNLLDRRPEELGTVQDSIRRARMNATRRGKDTAEIDALALRLEIRYGRPTRPVAETYVVPADAGVIYVPRGRAKAYADLGALPAGTRPSVGPGGTRRGFHARVVEESSKSKKLPGAVDDGDEQFVRLTVNRSEQAKWTGASRIRPKRVYVLDECADADAEDADTETAVRCRGRGQARNEEVSYREYLLAQACALGAESAAKAGVRDCARLDAGDSGTR